MKKILIISICSEKLHYFEFVKPLEDILKKNKIKFFTKHYLDLVKTDFNCNGIILSGTSAHDNNFLKRIDKFNWIKTINKPILGICGGMQIIGLIFDGKLRKKTEIGFYKEGFKKNFLGLNGIQEVYHLHNNYVDVGKSSKFEIFTNSKISQAVKKRDKEIYGVLFHPEVRQKDLIVNFCLLVKGDKN